MVISSRNPVHSVLFLILAFFNAAALFVLLGAEFLAMILVIVYVGAVAVLFLFVVMMLDINFAELRQGFLQYLPIGALIGIVLLAELVFVFGELGASRPMRRRVSAAPMAAAGHVTNTAGARRAALYPLHLSVPGGGDDPAGRHDRRHRADPAPARGRAAPEDRATSSRAGAPTRSRCVRCQSGSGI